MAADSLAAIDSYATPEQAWSPPDGIVVAPCFAPVEVRPADAPMCNALPFETLASPSASDTDFWATPDYLQMMASMSAEADAEAQRQAEEAARREADMQAQMAAFFSMQTWFAAGDAVSEPECVAMTSCVLDAAPAPVCGPEDGVVNTWSALVVEPGMIDTVAGPEWEVREILAAVSSVPDGISLEPAFASAPVGSVGPESLTDAWIAGPDTWSSDAWSYETVAGPGELWSPASLDDGEAASTGSADPWQPEPGIAAEEGAVPAADSGSGVANWPEFASAVAGDGGMVASPPEQPMELVQPLGPEQPMDPEQSSSPEYVYDWEDEERRQIADDSREQLNHEVYEYANTLNIESEGRFAEGVVYTETQLVARLQSHIDAPQAIDGVEYVDVGEAGGDASTQEDVSNDPLAWIPATKVTPRGTPTGIVSGWFADNAKKCQDSGGFLGAVGHMANGMAAGIVSLFDVVAPRCVADVCSVILFGGGMPRVPKTLPVQTREAAEFADYIYDEKFDDGGAEAGGLLGQLGIPYNPAGGLQAALFRGESGTFYLTARGTEGFCIEDWITNIEQACGRRSAAYESFITLVKQTVSAIERLGGTLVCAGHSMGGGIAIAGAHASGLPAEVINPAYVNPIYSRGQPAQIRINIVNGDLLEMARRASGLPAQGDMHYYRPQPCKGMSHNIGHIYDRR